MKHQKEIYKTIDEVSKNVQETLIVSEIYYSEESKKNIY